MISGLHITTYTEVGNMAKKENKIKKGEKKMEKYTISRAFMEAGKIGAENKTQMIGNIVTLLKAKGINKTKNGKAIDESVVSRQLNAMCYDIKKQVGRWKGVKLVQDDKQFKLIA